MILNQNSPEVKRTLLGKPSDYRSKSIEEADRGQLMTSQLNRNLSIPSKDESSDDPSE
jgi:hypothetical protein